MVLLIASLLGLDWLVNTDAGSKLLQELQDLASSLFKPLKQGVEREVARQTGATLAEKTADTLDALGKTGEGESGKPEKTPEAAPVKKVPTAEQLETDRLAEEFLKGGRTEPGTPVTGPVINPHARVFDGKDALTIMKELGMVPLSTADDAKIPLTREDLDGYIGPAPDGLPRKITLPTGKTIILTRIEAIGFEGEDKTVDGRVPKQIDFSKSVVITAELVEEVSKPAPGSAPAPGAGASAGAPSVPPPSPLGGATVDPQINDQAGGQQRSGTPPAHQTSATPSTPAADTTAESTGPDIQSAPWGSEPSRGPVLDISAEEAAEHDDLLQKIEETHAAGMSGQNVEEAHRDIYHRLARLPRVTQLDRETGKRYAWDAEHKDLMQDVHRLLGGLRRESSSAGGAAEPGSGAILDDKDISSPTEDFQGTTWILSCERSILGVPGSR